MAFISRSYILLCFILVATNVFPSLAQVKTFRFLDSKTLLPVPDADVYADSVFIAATTGNGNVKIDLGTRFNNLIVDHISYGKRTISFDSLTLQKVFKLSRLAGMLNEVVLDSEIQKDSLGDAVINPGWGSKTATFIPYQNGGYITQLQFRVVSVGGVKGLNYLPFKANLYSYDPATKMPGEPLLAADILVENPKGKKWAMADVSSHRIRIPEEGIYVVFIIPPFEEGLYERKFIQANFGTISAVPSLKLKREDAKHYSYRFDSYFNGNGFAKEWRRIDRRYYIMDVSLNAND